MSEKRKDAKGQVLRTEESQRKDLIYLCQYTDIREKRQTIDSSDLKELREKEQKIQASQQWIIKLCQDGRGYSTITSLSRSGAESIVIYAGNGPRTKI